MDKFKLEYEMKSKGITISELCNAIGISRSAYYKKTNGTSEFTLSEMSAIISCLKLDNPMDIFFPKIVS